jgi:sensor histidine kinase YesM
MKCVDKIRELFLRIKQEEEIKRRHELDFLQLQINPISCIIRYFRSNAWLK